MGSVEIEVIAQGPVVYLFGFRAAVQVDLDPNPLALFLMGRDVPLDADLAAALRLEFNAQERYRIIMLDAVQKVCAELLQAACNHVAAIEHPITDARAAFWRGYALGQYEAYSVAAGALSEIPIVAAIGLEGGA